nr:polysaccharide deacetylase family protein [Pseudonocardia acidicola]
MLAGAAGAGLHAAPALTAIGPLRRLTAPALAGAGRPGHLALTFDDGPDPASTPAFLRLLAEYDVRATFFVLGTMLERAPGLGRELAAAGHEVAVHGWDHRCLLLRGPRRTAEHLVRARDLVGEVTGQRPRWYRPPYGVFAAGAARAARRAGLVPVLWTAWGRDWSARASASSIVAAVGRRPASGGTVLLHDSDCTSTPGSWRRTLAALPRLLDGWRAEGLQVGPLAEHGLRSAQSAQR